MQISEMKALRSFQVKRHLINSSNVRNSPSSSFISIKQSQNPAFSSRHFHSTNHLRIQEDSVKDDNRKSWASSSSYGVDSGTTREASWGAFVDTITSSVRENDDGEDLGLIRGGENEVGSAKLGQEKLDNERSDEVVVVGDYGTGGSWGSSSVGGNNDVEAVESNRGGGNEVDSAKLGHEKLDRERSKWGGGGKANSVASRYEDPVLRRKKGKGKDKISWVCSDCGHSDGQWWGTCRSCNRVGTMVKFSEGDYGGPNRTSGADVIHSMTQTWLPRRQGESRPQRMTDVNRGIDKLKWRIPLHVHGEDLGLIRGGENEVGSAKLGQEKLDNERSDEVVVVGDYGTGGSWGSSSVGGNNDVEAVESNRGGGNEVDSAKLGHEKLDRERSKWGGGGKANSVASRYEDPVLRRKKGKGKDKISWVCSDCGHSDGQWWGTCRSCNRVGTMVKFSEGDYGGPNRTSGADVIHSMTQTWLPRRQGESRPQRMTDVNRGIDKLKWRIPLHVHGEDLGLIRGGENEVGSAKLGQEKLDNERSDEVVVVGDYGAGGSWGSSSVGGNNDVEAVESNRGGGNEVDSAKLGHEKLDRERSKWGGGGKANSVASRYEDPVLRRKKGKGKDKISWVCSDCGHSDGQWWGTCRSCNRVGTMVKFSEGDYGGPNRTSGADVIHSMTQTWLPRRQGESRPQRMTDVNRGIDKLKWRIPLGGLFGAEVARVLGGGLVPGSLVLVGGDPGVGKSTLLLQFAAIIAEGSNSAESCSVVYVSGEESLEQIGNRADRMRIGTEEIYLYSSTDIEDILEKIQPLSPRALIIDSIQTVYLKGVTGSAGSITQVKECTSALLRFSKKTNVPVLLIGHVTKSGDIAGPRVLEHIVDVVLYMEGDKSSSHRMLRSVKNRFGSTDELGVFEMSQSGLQAVLNPSEIFLSEPHSGSDFLAGLAVTVIMDGSRSFLIEIQALCVPGATVSRQVNGIQKSRADMIIAVLMKQAGLKIQENAIFLNVVSGVELTETAGDLAVAAAICSSVFECPIPSGVAFIGEIGLGGELRMVPRMEKRLNTVAKLGYKKCVIPESAEKSIKHLDFGEMEILGCKNLKQVISTVF